MKTEAPQSLAPSVVAQIERLGGVIAPERESTLAIGERELPLPAPLAQLRAVSFPAASRFAGTVGGHSVWSTELGTSGDLDEYACTQTRPYTYFGTYDSGNWYVLVALDDACPEDPEVFSLDHDDFSEPSCVSFHLSLSHFLAALELEPPKPTKKKRKR